MGWQASERYAVLKLAVDNSLDFDRLHIGPRFQAWLDAHDLHSCLEVVSRSELPCGETVVKFQYNNPQNESVLILRERRSEQGRRFTAHTCTCLHASFITVIWRPVHLPHALVVSAALGPHAVSSASCVEHALHYSWPCPFLLDNVHNSVILEIEGG